MNLRKSKITFIITSLSFISNTVFAHTNSIGYTNAGSGSVSFWYGTWHPSTNFNEGSIKLEGVDISYGPDTKAFDLLEQTLPDGLVSGTNYFSSDGSQLIDFDSSLETSYAWQGATFTGLSAGTYRFTYIPIANPTATWDPMDSVILSSTVTLSAAILVAAPSGPSAADTQSSLYAAADDLRRIINLQSMYLINSLSYECNIYDEKNLCFKVQTQNDSVIGNVNNMSTATAISSYRFNDNLSVGGFISDSYSDNNSQYIDVYDKAPLVGLFSNYRFNNKLQGLNFKTSMAFSDREIDQSRKVYGTSESGKGESGLSSFGIQASISYDMPVRTNIIWTPSVGARYTKITRNGYTETTTAAVTTPLTFDDINQERTTLIIGNALRYQLNDKTSMRAYVNYEQELNYNGAKFATTGVSGTTNFNLSSDIHHAKLVGGLGLSYQPKQNHEVSVAYNYRKSAMNANEISSVFASYAIGF